ncbi:MAG TPA: YbaK/EbsC family protein [Opitutaceae bacterium]
MSHASVHARLVQHLTAAGIAFRQVHHAPTFTSEDSARERGEPIECGAKALVVKADERFHLLVIPAHRKLSSKLARVALGAKQLRFATPDELLALTGLVPGAVPPFGEPILALPLTADPEVGTLHPRVAFNAGSREDSVIMAATDWRTLAAPAFASIIEPAG